MPLVAQPGANMASLLEHLSEFSWPYFCTSNMSATSEEGGGASSGTQPSIITVTVNILLPEIQVVEIFLSTGKDSVTPGQTTKSPLR